MSEPGNASVAGHAADTSRPQTSVESTAQDCVAHSNSTKPGHLAPTQSLRYDELLLERKALIIGRDRCRQEKANLEDELAAAKKGMEDAQAKLASAETKFKEFRDGITTKNQGIHYLSQRLQNIRDF